MLQCTQGCLFKLGFCVCLDKYPEVELLDSSLSLVIAFVLKSVLSDISMAAPAFFFFHFHEYLFPSLYFQSLVF